MSRTVIAVVDDLFFASKIRGTAEQVEVRVIFAKTIDAAIDAAEREQPSLIIADLHSKRCDAMELARCLKSDERLCSIRLIGFFSHVQTDFQRRAEAAGFDQVIPRSAFAKHLAELVRSSI